MALTGTAASTSGTGMVVTLDGSPDLTGVATDGSHVIWVNTASGRQFAAITAKDNTAKTVTTTTAYAVSLTGKSWAIGGKRATLDDTNTRKAFVDGVPGWSVDLQEAGTAYSLTSSVVVSASGMALTSSTSNYPTLTSSVNSLKLISTQTSNLGFAARHIKFTHTAVTRGTAIFPAGQATDTTVQDCIFDGFLTAIDGSNGAGFYFNGLAIISCEFRNGTGSQVINTGGTPALMTSVVGCFFHDNPVTVFGSCPHLYLEGNVFARNAAVSASAINGLTMRRNVVQGHTSTPVNISGCFELVVEGNVIYGNTGTGFSMTFTSPPSAFVVRNNAFGSNSSGDRIGLPAGAGDVALTADPFTNSAGNDFTPNSTAGGGALLRGAWNNVTAPGLAGTGHGDIGPFQSASSGSSGGLRTIGLNGGF